MPSYQRPSLTSLNCFHFPVAYDSDSPLPPQPRRVVVTGAGLISPMGRDRTENAAGFRAGRMAFSPVTLFDVSRQRVGTAGQADLPGEKGNAWSRMDRGTRLALVAAREAMADAGLTGGEMPMMIGTSAAAMPIGEEYYKQALATTANRAIQLHRVELYQARGWPTRRSACRIWA